MFFKNPDLRETYRELQKIKNHNRSQEEIIRDLLQELLSIKEEAFVLHLSRLIMEMASRAENPLFINLNSPLKLITYLVDLYYSIPNRTESEDLTEEKWQRITVLLNEVEMTYFISIGFPNEGELFHDSRDDKIQISLPTFISYFYNADLSYEEQILERLIRNCRPFDSRIKELFGFETGDIMTFLKNIHDLTNDHYNSIIQNGAYYYTHPDEWERLADTFIKRGIEPDKWIEEPELEDFKMMMEMNPGTVKFISTDEIDRTDISKDSLKHILEFITYDKSDLRGNLVYYASRHLSHDRPLLKINDKYLPIYNKFLVEAFYNRLDSSLSRDEEYGPRYRSKKDENLENRVLGIFKRFFPSKTHFYSNYSIDGQSENDLLILYNDTCIIVEIKDCGFREPMRDPVKAYDKIRSDFKKAIQLGYEQCHRVENAIAGQDCITIRDGKNFKKIHHTIRTDKIQDVWSIVVTDYKYGPIQTDLHYLLQRDGEALYPWSVCVDDLEIFLLVMRKMLKGIAPTRFIEFIDYRERFHEHLVCFDELEIDGLYLCERDKFKQLADCDTTLNTFGGMAEIFDAYYAIGLGLPYEYDLEHKKHYPMPDYAHSFDVNVVGLEDIK